MTASSVYSLCTAFARSSNGFDLCAAIDFAPQTLSFTRLQNLLDLTPGNLITHMRKLEGAGYLSSEKNGNGTASRTSISLTRRGRAALDNYTATLRGLLDGV
jgi:DNA-binding MarR family transcriptional regulator